jgi:hypothetical protein
LLRINFEDLLGILQLQARQQLVVIKVFEEKIVFPHLPKLSSDKQLYKIPLFAPVAIVIYIFKNNFKI